MTTSASYNSLFGESRSETAKSEPRPEFDGAIVRRAVPDDVPGLASVHVASWRETYGDLLPASTLRRLSVADSSRFWAELCSLPAHNSSIRILVATMKDVIVGFAASCPQRDAALKAANVTGEVSALYVLRSSQRRGIGRQLLGTAIQDQRLCGHASVGLWVLRENFSARRFYEAFGGEVIAERTERFDEVPIPEVAYAWRGTVSPNLVPL